jgi:hypothetical protein
VTVRYIRVNAISNLFAPATRAYGNVAVIGQVTPGPTPPADIAVANTPIAFTDPAEALRRCPGDLGASIQRCFLQTPGPSLVYGIRTADGPAWTTALDAASTLDAQIVVVARTPLDAAAGAANGAIGLLANHVVTISNTGADGQERIGVAMLAKGATDTALVTGNASLAQERMVYVAHKSDDDAAAAVAGAIAGYEPQVSLVLKPVNVNSASFTPTEIQTINGAVETNSSGPTGVGVNWLTHPTLIPGGGIYLGEGYTGNPGGGKKYIDVVRVIDDVSFRLKAQLIKTIGTLRISRAGLRTMVSQMEVVLIPLVDSGTLDDFKIHVPLLTILDKDENARTQAEKDALTNSHAQRLIQVVVAVSYAAAIHRISIDLVFS